MATLTKYVIVAVRHACLLANMVNTKGVLVATKGTCTTRKTTNDDDK